MEDKLVPAPFDGGKRSDDGQEIFRLKEGDLRGIKPVRSGLRDLFR